MSEGSFFIGEGPPSQYGPGAYAMRAPCAGCGCPTGVLRSVSGQDTIRCSRCDRFAYNSPRTETGRPQRSVRSRPNIKPSVRFRILERDGFRCVACGRWAPDAAGLHVDHMVPMSSADADAELKALLESEENLVTLCEECNLGKRDLEPRLRDLAILLIRLHRNAIERREREE